MDTIPWTVANDFMEHRLNQRLDHEVYGLKPKHRFFQQHPTVNDALANLICSGYITVTVIILFNLVIAQLNKKNRKTTHEENFIGDHIF